MSTPTQHTLKCRLLFFQTLLNFVSIVGIENHRRQVANPTRPARTLTSLTRAVRRGGENPGVDANGNSYDLSTKLLHLAWHPTENSIACAAANSLYMYYA
jgi:hypothetical protein